MRRSRLRASVVCVHAGKLLAVRLRDPESGGVEAYLPGGGVEPGETPAAAAAREALEETGYDVVVEAGSERVARYDFLWSGDVYDCTTHFFTGHLAAPDLVPRRVDDAAYHRGVVWISLADVRQAFGYHAAILSEIEALLPIPRPG